MTIRHGHAAGSDGMVSFAGSVTIEGGGLWMRERQTIKKTHGELERRVPYMSGRLAPRRAGASRCCDICTCEDNTAGGTGGTVRISACATADIQKRAFKNNSNIAMSEAAQPLLPLADVATSGESKPEGGAKRMMTGKGKCWIAVAIVSRAILVDGANNEKLSVPVTIAEPIGVVRRGEPAWGGIPFLPGQVKDVTELSLVDASGQPVPAQFSRLASYDDGSVQWALVDTIVAVPANGSRTLQVVTGKATVPTRSLSIHEKDNVVTVDTGPAIYTINKARFSLLESVKIGGDTVAGPGLVRLVTDEGRVYTGTKVTSAKWEYRGPIRATLRVDGEYVDEGGARYIFYTTRLTFWAGRALVRITHNLRNSEPQNGFDAKIKEATVALKLYGLDGERAGGAELVCPWERQSDVAGGTPAHSRAFSRWF
ncbi:MAG: hypothetical protein N2255_10560 [Kiritimatiellae bacterium]|nr:hypothetical protein [Kiritimatiellia bacterium]